MCSSASACACSSSEPPGARRHSETETPSGSSRRLFQDQPGKFSASAQGSSPALMWSTSMIPPETRLLLPQPDQLARRPWEIGVGRDLGLCAKQLLHGARGLIDGGVGVGIGAGV